jgi:peptide/nickel transport system substrate-binding protein
MIACTSSGHRKLLLKPADGNRYYGGTFVYNEEEFFKTLYPINITEVTGHRIAEQIYEGLVEFNQSTLAVEPLLAKSWEISDDGTLYTFHLRSDVYFQDSPCFIDGKGRKFSAKDVKYCFDRLCYYNPATNQGFWIFQDVVEGANEYQALTKEGKNSPVGVRGVKVLDDTTIQIQLYKPYAVFLARLGLIFAKIYPKEAIDKWGTDLTERAVGTGPFTLKLSKNNEVTFLTRNPDYWKKDSIGNKLPYLDHIKVTYIKEKRAELLEFRKGKSDLIYKFPLDMVDEVLLDKDHLKPQYAKFQLQYLPSMSLQYYGFLHPTTIFKDKRIRQAFCYAIDRDKLCKYTLKNTGLPGIYGYVPPGTGTYDPTLVKGYTYEPEKARQLLADAGFPKGKGFPKITLQLNAGGGRNTFVAEAIQKMIEETLNIDVDLLAVPWAQHTEAIEAAKVAFYRLGWIADYPDAENFLNLFMGKYVPDDIQVKTYINSYRYKNPAYDQALEKALACTDEKERNKLYALADQIAIDDAVVMPNYYDIDYRLLSPGVRNCPQNAMEYRNFREVYFVPIP